MARLYVTHYKKIRSYCLNDNIVSIEEASSEIFVHKWAAVEVPIDYNEINEKLTSIRIEGNYFGFVHLGMCRQFNDTFVEALAFIQKNNIIIDKSRSRFEVMPLNYRPDDASSQEEFWIPII